MSQDISSLTPDELSRWICEHMDPIPCIAADYIERWGPNKGTRMWRSVDVGEDGVKWVPRPYTDPEICLRIQESLLCKSGYLNTLDLVRESWMALPANMHYRERWIRAWAEAYALANGYRPEGGK